MTSSSADCPPHLFDAGASACTLIYTNDLTAATADIRGDDFAFHGTLTTAIAAGFATPRPDGLGNDLARDSEGFSFTQGVAQGAKVAMATFLPATGSYRTPSSLSAEAFSIGNPLPRMRYSLLALSSGTTLPDNPESAAGSGPSARLFNHSWNTISSDYEASAILIDQATRDLSSIAYNFGDRGLVAGPEEPSLHVIAAGNWVEADGCNANKRVLAPATSKNSIAVGATETYNQLGYTSTCSANAAAFADCPRQIASFSLEGFTNQRLKPDLVAPGTRSYGPDSRVVGRGGACDTDLTGLNASKPRYAWHFGTSFATPVVTGAAALVKEWLGLPIMDGGAALSDPSPALVKAVLVGSAKNLVPILGGAGGCSSGFMLPAPDRYQGWGGLALDRLFRDYESNYFVKNQDTTLTDGSPTWTKTLYLSGGTTRDVRVALVWSDRASAPTISADSNLVNDLNLTVTIVGSSVTRTWYGNYYYTSPTSSSRDGYSLAVPPESAPGSRDSKNNVERIDIDKTLIPAGATAISVTVAAASLSGDGVDPFAVTTLPPVLRQDFAVFVENADETP